MIETAQAFGVDIGGSGIKAAPVNLEKGEFAEPRLKILTPEVSTPKAVGEIVRQQLEHFEVPESAPVGIAFPAPIHVGEKLGYMANLDQSWVGVDVTEVFSEACGRPVTVVNDADAAGLAEQQFGAAKGQDGLVIATTLGTGIGTALIFNGELIPNTELGHLELLKGKGDAEKYAASSIRKKLDMGYKKWAKRLTKYYSLMESTRPAAVRRRRWRVPRLREVPAVHRHQDPDRRSQAAQRGRHHRRRILREHQAEVMC